MAFAFSPAWSPQLRSILRIMAGLMFMLHGSLKLIGFPAADAKLSEHAPPLIRAAGLIELICGALIALGLLTSIAAILASGEMAVAYFKQHAPNDFWPVLNQGELAALYCFVFLYLAFAGPGPWSLDALLFKRRT